ncbi:choline ABC transporter ATP-binding protein [Natronospirillum operosum]|uniref:Choline ABC transporter ATP-binding protein n=1 Tax=Natronospirillum operosum TaxID=2759953 RepID=A0A4Z0WAK4_9GAMM|nr:choline ABC transporter ATP-binding protein [Natronospirillum operosum]TGG90726.1 choline ABC transporter ATP-binding protein [Natronospirillum operosum]
MIELNNVSVVFGQRPQRALEMLDQGADRDAIKAETGQILGVQEANLTIPRGEICVLMGLSGSGKSSLLRTVNGLNAVTRGEVLIEHEGQQVDFAKVDAATQRDIRTRRISMVFQSFALMPWLTVEENVAFGLRQQHLSKTDQQARVDHQLALVGLDAWRHAYPDELSGGMRQRVGLARALATESDILLMDEPFSALDPLIRHQLQSELLELQAKLQKTILFVSHDLDEALRLGNNIVIMKDGRIVQQGPPEDIILYPADDYVKSFVANTNPLNTLEAGSVMRRLDDIPADADNNRCISQRHDVWVMTSEDIMATRVTMGGESFSTQRWQPGQAIESLDRLPTRIPAATPMRNAVEICYVTGHNLLVEADGRLVGALGEREIYHTLLSKHLSDS